MLSLLFHIFETFRNDDQEQALGKLLHGEMSCSAGISVCEHLIDFTITETDAIKVGEEFLELVLLDRAILVLVDQLHVCSSHFLNFSVSELSNMGAVCVDSFLELFLLEFEVC